MTLPIHPEASRKSPLSEDKKHQFQSKTHQLNDETHQFQSKIHQLEEILEKTDLPSELKLKLEGLGKSPKNEDINSMIYALSEWRPLTALQIAEFLTRKDKKHLVRKYLTPLVKDGLLKYVYPERGNSPNQAYIAE